MARCVVMRVGDTVAFVRMSGSKRCADCDRPSVALCDFETAPDETCDRRMCGQHRTPVGPDVDHCTLHKNALPVNSLPLEMKP